MDSFMAQKSLNDKTKLDKINHAYYGGVQNTIKTIQKYYAHIQNSSLHIQNSKTYIQKFYILMQNLRINFEQKKTKIY